jgi:pimeloyl-ACP methyl ester carboxylesterase
MLRFFTIAALSALLTAAAPPPQPLGKSCYVDGFETPMRCVTISVPLDYDAPATGTIEVTAAIAPATTAKPAPDPLFVFAGGPGQAATGMGPWLNTAFAPARRERDIVLFDIRGTGLSTPVACAISTDTSAFALETIRRDAEACAAKAGRVATFLSSREIVEDIERMRRALRVQHINLWGGSFGTRLSQHYARAYGKHVRAVVLDAATPTGSSIFLSAPRYGEEALQNLFSNCAADKPCAKAFPNLKEDFATLRKQTEAAPLTATATDPRSGQPVPVRIDLETLTGNVRGSLYAGFSRSVLPFAITQALRGNQSPFLALGAATSEWSIETMSFGSMLGVICGEDVEVARRAPAASRSYGFMGDSYYRAFEAACSAWPHRALPEPMLQTFTSSIPAMAISGALDPVTPPAAAEEALAMFGRRNHVVIPFGFHTNSSSRCIAELIGKFLADPQAGAKDHACVARITQPRFILSPTL